jgi:hypothetical protein
MPTCCSRGPALGKEEARFNVALAKAKQAWAFAVAQAKNTNDLTQAVASQLHEHRLGRALGAVCAAKRGARRCGDRA